MKDTAPMPRYLLAYSGGLDTSVMLKWLQLEHGAEVFTMTADLGQTKELKGVREKAMATGAKGVFIEDLREEFVRDYVWPSLKAGALYQEVYPMATSLGRPLIAKRLVELAREVGADAIAHGCTGKGNDQVRFELTYAAFAPELEVIAPWRVWDIRSREDALAYAAAKGVPVVATKEKIYSRDRNLWHISHEGGELEDPAAAPLERMFLLTTDPRNAPDDPEEVSIEFDRGIPVAVNGERMSPAGVVEQLNTIAGRHGVGRADIVEDRLVGMKSRGVYETPGGTLLYTAHSELEKLVLDRRTLAAKDLIAPRYADLVYEGRWWTTEREAYDAFIDVTQDFVTGTSRLRLYKGSHTIIGRESPHSLYDEATVTFGEDDVYQQSDAAGFIRLFGLPQRVAATRRKK